MPLLDLELATKIAALKEQGLGYRSIAKVLGLHYKQVERLYKRYLAYISSTSRSDSEVTNASSGSTSCSFACDTSVPRSPEDRLSVAEDGLPLEARGLGRTEKLVLEVLAKSINPMTPSMIVEELRLRGIKISRNAVWQALRRLQRRGLVVRYERYVLLAGEVLRGAYTIAEAYTCLIRVHNLRVFGVPVVKGEPVPLEEALLRCTRLGLTFPVSQAELNNDYHAPQLARFLEELGVKEIRVYVKNGRILRVEARLWNPRLVAEPSRKHEWIKAYTIAINIARRILEAEVTRLGIFTARVVPVDVAVVFGG